MSETVLKPEDVQDCFNIPEHNDPRRTEEVDEWLRLVQAVPDDVGTCFEDLSVAVQALHHVLPTTDDEAAVPTLLRYVSCRRSELSNYWPHELVKCGLFVQGQSTSDFIRQIESHSKDIEAFNGLDPNGADDDDKVIETILASSVYKTTASLIPLRAEVEEISRFQNNFKLLSQDHNPTITIVSGGDGTTDCDDGGTAGPAVGTDGRVSPTATPTSLTTPPPSLTPTGTTTTTPGGPGGGGPGVTGAGAGAAGPGAVVVVRQVRYDAILKVIDTLKALQGAYLLWVKRFAVADIEGRRVMLPELPFVSMEVLGWKQFHMIPQETAFRMCGWESHGIQVRADSQNKVTALPSEDTPEYYFKNVSGHYYENRPQMCSPVKEFASYTIGREAFGQVLGEQPVVQCSHVVHLRGVIVFPKFDAREDSNGGSTHERLKMFLKEEGITNLRKLSGSQIPKIKTQCKPYDFIVQVSKHAGEVLKKKMKMLDSPPDSPETEFDPNFIFGLATLALVSGQDDWHLSNLATEMISNAVIAFDSDLAWRELVISEGSIPRSIKTARDGMLRDFIIKDSSLRQMSVDRDCLDKFCEQSIISIAHQWLMQVIKFSNHIKFRMASMASANANVSLFTELQFHDLTLLNRLPAMMVQLHHIRECISKELSKDPTVTGLPLCAIFKKESWPHTFSDAREAPSVEETFKHSLNPTPWRQESINSIPDPTASLFKRFVECFQVPMLNVLPLVDLLYIGQTDEDKACNMALCWVKEWNLELQDILVDFPDEHGAILSGYICDHLIEHKLFKLLDILVQNCKLSLLNNPRTAAAKYLSLPQCAQQTMNKVARYEAELAHFITVETMTSTADLSTGSSNLMRVSSCQLGRRDIHPEVFYTMVDKTTGNLLSVTDNNGRRPVVRATDKQDRQLYFKILPELPAVEIAATKFIQYWVPGHLNVVPHCDLIFSNEGRYPIMMTHARGERYMNDSSTPSREDRMTLNYALDRRPDILENLDEESISFLLVATMLINPEDGKPDNYLVERMPKNPNKWRIVAIDNDHSFTPGDGTDKKTSKSQAITVKTILFCLDEMDESVHPNVLKRIRETANSPQFMQRWLKDTTEELKPLFECDDERRQFLENLANKPLKMDTPENMPWDLNKVKRCNQTCREGSKLRHEHIDCFASYPFRTGTARGMFTKLQQMLKLCEGRDDIKHYELLHAIEPQIGHRYLTVAKQFPSSGKKNNRVMTRFEREDGKSYQRKGHHFTTIVPTESLARAAANSFVVPRQIGETTFAYVKRIITNSPEAELVDFEKFLGVRTKAGDIISQMYDGDLTKFLALMTSDSMTMVLELLDFELLTDEIVNQVNNKILKLPDSFSSLCLIRHPSPCAVLELNFRTITTLVLKGTKDIQSFMGRIYDEIRDTIQVLDLSGTELVEFGTKRNPFRGNSLGVLRTDNCPQLKRLNMDVTSLMELRTSECPVLETVNLINTNMQLRLCDFSTCPRISEETVNKVSSCSPNLTELRLEGCDRVKDAEIRMALACLSLPRISNLNETDVATFATLLDEHGNGLVAVCHALLQDSLTLSASMTELISTLGEDGLVRLIAGGQYDLNCLSRLTGMSCLHAAVKTCNQRIIGKLLTCDAEINLKMSDSEMTPLMIAASDGNLETVLYLLQKGADVTFAARGDITALHLVLYPGSIVDEYYTVKEETDISLETREYIALALIGETDRNINPSSTALHATPLELALELGSRKVALAILRHSNRGARQLEEELPLTAGWKFKRPELLNGLWTGPIIVELGNTKYTLLPNPEVKGDYTVYIQLLTQFLKDVIDNSMAGHKLDDATKEALLSMLHIQDYPITYPQRGHQDKKLSNANPFKMFPPEVLQTTVKYATDKYERLNRAVGVMVGGAVGDSVGSQLQFLPIVDEPFQKNSSGKRCGYHLAHVGTAQAFQNPRNIFDLQEGQFTNAASMMQCMADSLIECLQYDGSDARKRYHAWWYHGYNNSFKGERKSVGLGANMKNSLSKLAAGQDPEPIYNSTEKDAGNGSVTRLGPLSVFLQDREKSEVCITANASSRATHPGMVAAYACEFVAYLQTAAIQQAPMISKDAVKVWLDRCIREFITASPGRVGDTDWDILMQLIQEEKSVKPGSSTELCWDWRKRRLKIGQTIINRNNQYNGYPVSENHFGAYSMDALAIALHCVYHTDSFDTCLEKTVNFLGDTASTGSIAGQLAGALYGYSEINKTLVHNLRKWDDDSIAFRGILLYVLGKDCKPPLGEP